MWKAINFSNSSGRWEIITRDIKRHATVILQTLQSSVAAAVIF